MLKRAIFSFSSGMMLMECLFVMAISGVLFLCISRAYPYVMNTLHHSYQQHQLDIFLRERLLVLETQLRRTGYCHGDCANVSQSKVLYTSPLKIGQYAYQDKNSCVIFAYDVNSNGRWDSPFSRESDYFGYRLKNGQLEQLRGVQNCTSSGWQRFFESHEIEVTEFILRPYSRQCLITEKPLFYLSISLKFHLKQSPTVKLHYQNDIRLRNVTTL
ncbi:MULTISPECIES: prepilin peptidase-dependent protein [Enterobacterales]|uniref:prepilin peptidase-dependent protein n=1 Tax=Enterobacterales TaxID=91347 RepID=UPI000847E4C1|nr:MULTISPECIES: prepilin peptidase-dependent protein [Enterobacterales]WOO49138.1 prepilin peptidase-dependent protein [Hafnia alvei]MCK9780693.1 prepilin peptidase-dependent protein [Proteus columbae]MCT6516003.1 prepilin peptidase-dependent protein [Proteus vulgaris]ODQ07835.1 potassium:proton antiporter [Shigella sp. FC130]OEI95341.1 potassium:proton antiporter [Shigella sp. FC1655]